MKEKSALRAQLRGGKGFALRGKERRGNSSAFGGAQISAGKKEDGKSRTFEEARLLGTDEHARVNQISGDALRRPRLTNLRHAPLVRRREPLHRSAEHEHDER